MLQSSLEHIPGNPSDAELARRCKEGDGTAFDALYVRHLKGIYAFIFYRTMDTMTAEDLTSQTFLKALERIGSYSEKKGAFSTWLYRIARNTVFDHFRTKHKTEDIETMGNLAGEDDPFLKASDALDARAVRDALKDLPSEKRELILLRLWDGLSYAEIAAITGKSEASLKMMFKRSMTDLQQKLGPGAFFLLCTFSIYQQL